MNTLFKTGFTLIVSFTIVALFSVTSWSQADIVDLKDLITDADDAVWTDINGNELTMDSLTGLSRVSRGEKLGGIQGSSYSRTGELDIDTTLSKETVDVNLSPTLNDSPSAVNGTYLLELPDLKRIQLEVRHDAFLDSQGSQSALQFYVEVFTKDEQGAFNRDAVLETGIDPVTEGSRPVYRIEKNASETESFTSNPAIIDLTKYAGQSIRLNLVSFLPAGARTTNSGRWVNARLVGATFNFHFGDIEKVNPGQFNFQGKFADPRSSSRNVLASTIQNIGATETIDISGISNYNDTGISTVSIGSVSYAYMAASEKTAAFDLSDFPGETMYSIDEGDLEDSLLRTGSPPAPGPSGTPFFVLSPPSPTDYSSWYNWYTGIGGSVVEIAPNTYKRVHALFHAEDASKSGTGINSIPPWVYKRIGYARSDWNSGYEFTITPNTDGEPIIESFQPESAVDGSKEVNGTGAPTMIAYGDYYYCFYSRWIDNTAPFGGWTMPSSSIIGGGWDQICAARALKSNVHNNDHDENGNPWKKYQGGNWTEDGLGGVSTPVINENWRAFPQVIYSNFWSEHIIVCTGPDGFYLYTQNGAGMESWDNGMLFMPYAENRLYHYPVLIGNGGDSHYGPNDDYQLYFAYDEDTVLGGHKMVRRPIELDH